MLDTIFSRKWLPGTCQCKIESAVIISWSDDFNRHAELSNATQHNNISSDNIRSQLGSSFDIHPDLIDAFKMIERPIYRICKAINM